MPRTPCKRRFRCHAEQHRSRLPYRYATYMNSLEILELGGWQEFVCR